MLPALFPGASPTSTPSTTTVGTTSGGLLLGEISSAVRGVCIAFDATALEETPLWTRLDDTTGPFTVTGWSIRRGRAFETDRTQAGHATIDLIDTTGDFDPTNAGAYFAGKLNPLKQGAIALRNPVSGVWTTLFRGLVDDWEFDVDVTEDLVRVRIHLVDAFDLFAATEFTVGNAGHLPVPTASAGNVYYQQQTVEQRLHKVLDDVGPSGWPIGLRDVFSGNVNVQEVVYPPRTSALAVMQDTADAEFPGVANLYMSKDGRVTFHGRYARFRPQVVQYGIDTWNVGDRATVAGDSTVAPITSLSYARGKTHLINSALATPQNIADADIAAQLSEDTTSKTAHGVRSISFENLLTGTSLDGSGRTAVQETKLFANYYKTNFASPTTRVSSLRFRACPTGVAYAGALWSLLCGVEISDKVSITTNHVGGGGFTASEYYVEGIRYSARPHPDYPLVDMELDVSPTAFYTTEPA